MQTHFIPTILSTAILRNASKNLDSTAKWSVNEVKNKYEYSNMDKEKSVIHQVAELPNKSITELKSLWRTLFNQEPPKFGKNYLVPRLAYRLQELAYGSLPESYTRKLDEMASALEKGAKQVNPYIKNKPKNGTKLIRAYCGNTYEVTVVAEGYVFEHQPYKSLSAIARKIVGHRVNGPKWFGLRGNGELKR